MKSALLFAVPLILLLGCSSEPAVDPATGNPANETPAQYRERIEKSDLAPEVKKHKLDELDQMNRINEEMLKRGQNSVQPPAPTR